MLERFVKTLPAVGLAVCCFATGAVRAAESPFIGDWKLNPAQSRMPDEMKVTRTGAKYGFDFGGVVETIAVDGTFQPGYGKTLLSVKPEAPDRWIVERQEDGKPQVKATWTLSKDGRTLTDKYLQFTADGSTFSMDYVYQRTSGGGGFTGDWQSIKETMNSPYALQVKALEGDGLSLVTAAQHTTKNLKLDGKEYPTASGGTSSAQRVNAHTLLITDKAGGIVRDTRQLGVSADLKTLTITTHVPGRDRPNVMVFDRQ
jgi:hypothetical protein